MNTVVEELVRPAPAESGAADFSEVLAAAGPGTCVRIPAGVYREPLVIKRGGEPGNPVRIEAAGDGAVVFSGSDRIAAWTLAGADRYRTAFRIEAEERLRKHFGVITLPLQVWVDGRRLELVESPDGLAANTFAYDGTDLWMQLEAGVDPVHSDVQVARRGNMLRLEADHVVLSGITVTRCAASVQVGASEIRGDHVTVEDCRFSETAGGVGVKFRGRHLSVRRNEIHHNGQMGFAFLGVRSAFEENFVHDNDLRNFCDHPMAEWNVWESGGGKVAYSRDCVFRHNRFVGNRHGPGLWLDIDNFRNRIEANYFSRNGHSSIMVEISYDNVVCNNIIVDTLQSNYSGSGILVQLSSRTRIYHNLVYGAAGYGVHLRWHVRQRDIHPYDPADPEAFVRKHGFRQEDWMAPDGDYPVKENDVRNNVLVDCLGGSLCIDFHSSLTADNTSDYNLHWNSRSLHPMAGGHRLLEWQEMTGLDEHSIYSKEMHRGPLFIDPDNGDFRPHPDGPLARRVPCIDEAGADFLGRSRRGEATVGPFELP
ncbi:MAG: right-handed parallel beta-helix repeat-containing protein [Opitutales bacterium]|nr:right-handed parallel beta-helix repeat-containing protein [Opitutales bacterium]